jgi:hypothetical protein
MGAMPMRSDCRHYDSRTYKSGEIVRKCRLDLAPEAPWRCPDDCPSFTQRRFDAGWNYGSLASSARSVEPEPEGDDIAALLDQAEDIVNAAAPELIAEFEGQDRKRANFLKRGKRGKGKGKPKGKRKR